MRFLFQKSAQVDLINRASRFLLPVACLFLITACGGGGGGSGSSGQQPGQNPPAPPPVVPTSVNLTSDTGDYIGGGQDYSYTNADTEITATAQDALLTITISGDESWRGEFRLPDTYSQLETGTYSNLTRYPFHDPAVGGLSWSGEGRGCNSLTGTITIDEVIYDGTTLTGIDLQFEQYCEGGSPALRGDIHWDVNDLTSAPGPVVPPAAGLWQPAAGVTPATGSYVYLESQPGDYIGAGANYLYTNATAVVTVNAGNARLAVSINGNEGWNGDFQAMNSISFLEAGYYGDLQRYPFQYADSNRSAIRTALRRWRTGAERRNSLGCE
jgi:hypothetical protein